MENSTQDIVVGCVVPVVSWIVAYLIWNRKIGKEADSFYRDLLKMSEDQIDAMNKQGAVFVALMGTMAPILIMVPVGWGRRVVPVVFLTVLLVSPVILYWKNPPKAVPSGPVTARGFFFKNYPRVISLIAFVYAIVAPLFVYHHGPPNLFFAAMGFMMFLFGALAYFFVSLY